MDLNNPIHRKTVIRELSEVINRNNLEAGSNTPDFLIAEYLVQQIEALDAISKARRDWYADSSLPKNQSQANGHKPFFRT